MLPGNALIVSCPHCGGTKELMSLMSCNTFGRVVWSDNKTESPMMPSLSPIQKCPVCGKYFMLSRQKDYKYSIRSSLDTGRLKYAEIKEAIAQFTEMTGITDSEKQNILLLQIWAYNDEFTRFKKKEIPIVEREYFISVVNQLLALDNVDDILKAELLREIGRFDEALHILDSYYADNDFLKGYKEQFKKLSECKNTHPFVINSGVF